MGPLFTLVLKDLRRRLAEPAGLLINLAIPLAITGTMALAFGTSPGGDERTPILRLVVADLDHTVISGILNGSTQSKEAAERMEVKQVVDRDEGLRLLKEGDYAALVVIPKGFTDSILKDGKGELELVKNPSQSVMPIVAEQGVEAAALYISIGRRLLGPDTDLLRKLAAGEGWDDSLKVAGLLAGTYERVKAADQILFPPLVEVKTERKEKSESGVSFMAWMYPGVMVMSLLYVALMQMKDLLREREAGTFRRMLGAPLAAGQVLASKILSVALVVSLAMGFLLVIGSFAFGLRWGAPLPLAAVCLLVVFASTGFAAFLYSLVRTERQGDAFGGILVMVMSLLGGSFVPPQVLPEWLRTLSLFTLSHWAHEALRSLIGGGGWAGASGYAAALAAIAFACMASGVALLGRRHRMGTL